MEKKFLFAGSFNPYTIGHHSVYENAQNILNDSVIIVGIAQNPNKKDLIPQLLKWRMNPAFPYFMSTNVKVVDKPMLADYANENGCSTLIRSLRNSVDLIQETDLATWNKEFGVDTVFIPSDKELDHVSSSAIREIDSLGKDMSKYFVNDIQYKRYKNKKPKRIIVCGRMGSGKSSFIKDKFKNYTVFDMDKVVAQQVQDGTRSVFKTFFEHTQTENISSEWDHPSLVPYKQEVVDVIENMFDEYTNEMTVFEVSAFTAYEQLEKYYEDSIIIYVQHYENGKQREVDLDFMVKTMQLQHIPKVTDFIIDDENGKLPMVLHDINELIRKR